MHRAPPGFTVLTCDAPIPHSPFWDQPKRHLVKEAFSGPLSETLRRYLLLHTVTAALFLCRTDPRQTSCHLPTGLFLFVPSSLSTLHHKGKGRVPSSMPSSSDTQRIINAGHHHLLKYRNPVIIYFCVPKSLSLWQHDNGYLKNKLTFLHLFIAMWLFSPLRQMTKFLHQIYIKSQNTANIISIKISSEKIKTWLEF